MNGRDELLALLGSFEFEEYGDSSLVEARWGGMDLQINLRVRVELAETFWLVTCHKCYDAIVQFGAADPISLNRNHPLLRKFIDRQGELFFNSIPSDINAALGALYRRHDAIFGEWIPFSEFLCGALATVLTGGYGSLGSGPISVLAEYSEVLTEMGIRNNVVETHAPKHWDGQKWCPVATTVAALVMGKNYVIAESFDAVRRDASVAVARPCDDSQRTGK
jgi:hypothetical protein